MKTKTILIVSMVVFIAVILGGVLYLINQNKKYSEEQIQDQEVNLKPGYITASKNIISFDDKIWRLTKVEGGEGEVLLLTHLNTYANVNITEGSGDFLCEPPKCVKTLLKLNNIEWNKIIDTTNDTADYIYYTNYKSPENIPAEFSLLSLEANLPKEDKNFEADLEKLVEQVKINL